jgi:polar amino acid transport system substrate-binding protein
MTFSRKILVGVVEAPPLFMKTADGQWEGLGVDIWKTVAQEMGVCKNILKDILHAFGLMILMSLAAGIMVFLFEKRQKKEMLGDGVLKGISHGIWWSVVTMTTVGYGDKAPKTIGGRIVAIIWMLLSIVFISSFTAHINTSLTLSELRDKVHSFKDLHTSRVGSIIQSEASNFLFNLLFNHGIAIFPLKVYRIG